MLLTIAATDRIQCHVQKIRQDIHLLYSGLEFAGHVVVAAEKLRRRLY